MEMTSPVPLLAILVSFIAPIGIVLAGRSPNLREGVTFSVAVLKFVLVAIVLLPAVLHGKEIEYVLCYVAPGLPIALRVDAFGMLFALVASILWIVTSIYSVGYMRGLDEHSQTRYYSFFAIALSTTLGVAFSANLLTMYIFYELLSLSTYPLVTHHQDKNARTGGRKYLLYIMGTSIALVLPAMIISYQLAGTLDFQPQGFLAGTGSSETLGILLLMFFFGFAKSGVMPFHSWLPGAMVAPTPVSSLLHAVAVVKVGVFCTLRTVTGVFGVDLIPTLSVAGFSAHTLLCIAASATILIASFIALTQDNLKRRLAFSTIGQLSYILLGILLLTRAGMVGSMMHIAMHAFGKITLFFCAGAIFVATGRKYISEMVGLGRAMPITMGAFLVGSLSVIGLPPTGGFLSKWNMLVGAADAESVILLSVYLLSSLLNAAYFFPIVFNAFCCTPEDAQYEPEFKEAPIWCVVPLVITAIASVLLFLSPDPFMNLAEMYVDSLLAG